MNNKIINKFNKIKILILWLYKVLGKKTLATRIYNKEESFSL